MAVKIVRQTNKIALLGAPTSAAAMSAGLEGAPTALRAAGLVDRLKTIGYAVADLGDDPVQLYKPDEESPRARNLTRVLASLESLKPRVEQAVKSAALPLILAGDCSVALATVAGARRYFRKVSMIYMDRDADLNTPATTATGCVDGMVVSHLAGRGAAELVRFWGEPPLVREPDLALFGVARLDPPEEQLLATTPVRRYLASDVQRLGAAAAAHAAIDRIRGNGYQFVLHLDVDVIAEIASYAEYASFSERLRAQGFQEDVSEAAPVCRWLIDEMILDVMPTEQKVLGFTSRWYREAMASSQEIDLDPGLRIRTVTAPYFIATKLEAFRGRGHGDFAASHDLEDILTVIDGREEITNEITAAKEVQPYIAAELSKLLKTSAFLDSLPGHLLPDATSQARASLLLNRIKQIANQE